jgi:hypothetical protein
MSTDPSPNILQDYEAALSQEAMLTCQELDLYVQTAHPDRYPEFADLLADTLRHDKDPAALALSISSWTAPLL